MPPPKDCALCPRLAQFRTCNQSSYPAFFNGAVPSFGDMSAPLLIVGLAPGLKGANATGRPFTGDYAGDVLYHSLLQSGLAKGNYAKHAQDGLSLTQVRITNAVRCVPPENKPIGSEIAQCNSFLRAEIAAMPKLRAIVALGSISHHAVLRALDCKLSLFKFAHGSEHILRPRNDGIVLLNSYHCSRYNINTGRLTQAMFDAIIERAKKLL